MIPVTATVMLQSGKVKINMLQEIIDLGEIKEQGITNLIYPQRLAKLINHPNIATNHIRL